MTNGAPRANRRSYLLKVGEPSVVVPARIANLLERHGRLSELRVRTRGLDPEASAVLEDIRLAALLWAGSASGTEGDRAPEPDARSKWFTTGQAASHLGITREAVGKACREGRLTATRTGDRWVIGREDLEQFRAARAA
ncbi:helix-turn-helix domain-containing protein [Aeromicrobium sp. 179-A 4D2 NHS]|uniref:helix-turn-helix domain-containing protein n=1 Tax=Aeromicrobium sp. 179-A 4D2 NHS TaxID=3142375 RepID=UPI0039A3C682